MERVWTDESTKSFMTALLTAWVMSTAMLWVAIAMEASGIAQLAKLPTYVWAPALMIGIAMFDPLAPNNRRPWWLDYISNSFLLLINGVMLIALLLTVVLMLQGGYISP